jgi:predicted aspartyl protease
MHGLSKSAGLIVTAVSVCFAASNVPAPNLPTGTPQYTIKLGPFIVPPTRNVGMVVKARINGGPVLRLLLDSGSQYVVLDRKSAARSRCSGGSELDLIGAGATTATAVKSQHAETVQIGELTLHDVPLLIQDRSLADGIQGVLPLSIFSEFLIRLDIPRKSLDLLPYPAEQPKLEGALRTVESNRMLFLQGKVNEKAEGYFLLDTGAAYSAISRKLARELNIAESLADHIPLQGGTTAMEAALIRGSVRVRLGTREMAADPVVAVDLSGPSRFHRIDIAGLIGYPALCDSVVTVSYRDSLVRIEQR